MALSLPEYSSDLAARIVHAAQYRFQGEHSGILEDVRLAVVATLRNPDDIVEFLSHARGCYIGAELYRQRGDMDGLTGEHELWRLFLTWGDTLVCNAMAAFTELPLSEDLMDELRGVFGHLDGIRWKRRTWMDDLSIQIALQLQNGEMSISEVDVDGSEARTSNHLCQFLMAIRAFHGAAAYFRLHNREDEANKHFTIGQRLIDKAAETYGWLMVDAVADVPKH